ncbi:uncharacterized protein LACBIDRAFT_298814 [Laccaria bicolor S238N-H82]|uniref:Predicted protein n=1 Tax=Laccaria bicolor (strain S238N-H82 / ATCC MYA-4686) TaxID=486041 RepID=B0E3H6_LACBS|nr:uncharacterized protein LACBIDRAFT_298814 [Laccaria bicolor S238N-H82]EDQ98606.1 predicted protein [Laccaria bicolor S238N-H82]|eukprot:XP_001890741.1 predicted protein [Laccaria bicolor S238N-H82]
MSGRSLKTDKGAKFDVEVDFPTSDIIPTVTWGTSPQDVVAITDVVWSGHSRTGTSLDSTHSPTAHTNLHVNDDDSVMDISDTSKHRCL